LILNQQYFRKNKLCTDVLISRINERAYSLSEAIFLSKCNDVTNKNRFTKTRSAIKHLTNSLFWKILLKNVMALENNKFSTMI